MEHPEQQTQEVSRCAARHYKAQSLWCEPHIGSVLEVILVSTAVVTLLGGCRWIDALRRLSLGPFILTAGAVLPTLVHGGTLSDLGLRLGRARQDAVLFFVSGLCMLGLGTAGVLMFRHWSVTPPAGISVPRDDLLPWILFQLLFVALPEELFFRGYILGNNIGLRQGMPGQSSSSWKLACLFLSAGLFAFTHVLVSGDAASVFTFFPGLLFAGLFVRMESLIPVILLHGGANIGYAMILETIG